MSFCHVRDTASNGAFECDDPDISALLAVLGQVSDPRGRRGRCHELVFILACAVVAVLAGAVDYRQVGSQAADLDQSLLVKLGAKYNWFRRRYDWPSEATLRRALQSIDAHELDLLVGSWLFQRAHRDSDDLLVIALDGKVLRGAWTDANDQVTLFSAMIHAKGVTVAQLRVPDGTNEITQVSALLDPVVTEVDQRVMVTIDAAHTQRDTAEYLKGQRGFDYLMTVKANQPGLLAEVFKRCRPLLYETPEHVVQERGHGRINRWSTWTTSAAGIDFPHIAQLACVRRDVFDLDGQRISKEFALVITSASAITAAEVHTHLRGHWGVENKTHWVRDTCWREDQHRAYVGSGQHAMAALRNLALGLIRLQGTNKIKEAVEAICRNRNRALHLLAT